MPNPDYLALADWRIFSGRNIAFEKGLGAAEDGAGTMENRSYDRVFSEVMRLVAQGIISDGTTPGTFDDRKFRYESHEVTVPTVRIALGPTHWKAYQDDLDRPPRSSERLREAGRKKYGEPYAHFSRAFAVLAVPRTADGSLVMGKRTNREYTGTLHGAGTYVQFIEDPAAVDLRANVLRGLQKEFNIKEGDLAGEPIPLGISCTIRTGETDLSFLVPLRLPDAHFQDGRWKQGGSQQHRDLVFIRSGAELAGLVSEGITPEGEAVEVLYSTYHALRNLRPGELAA